MLVSSVNDALDIRLPTVAAFDHVIVRAEVDGVEYEVGRTGQLPPEAFAGGGFEGVVGKGQAVRIFTGAPMPEGADRVIIQEVVRRDGDYPRCHH